MVVATAGVLLIRPFMAHAAPAADQAAVVAPLTLAQPNLDTDSLMVEVAIKVTQAAPGSSIFVLDLLVEVEVEVLALLGSQATAAAAETADNSCNMHHMASKEALAWAQHPMEDGLVVVVVVAVQRRISVTAAPGVVVVAPVET
jgi:hypothetical protein